MTQPTSLLPELSGAYLPPASPQLGLKDGELETIGMLATKLSFLSFEMVRDQLYYDGLQRLTNLGVSIPPQLAGVRTVVDWPRICVDPLVDRAVREGFRLPGQTDIDSELEEIWQANDGDSEFSLCTQDSLTLGRGYMIVGSPDSPGDAPIVTVESPFNLAMNWDPRIRAATAAYQSYEVEGVFRAVLYLPDVTVSMSRDQNSGWTVDDRDEHHFGAVTVVRFPNRQRSSDREGRSEITPAIRNLTDSTCRTLLGMEIAREFYSVPHRYLLGAQESDFFDDAGNPKAAVDMVMSKMLAIQRDDNGDLPTIGQFEAFDPSVFTKMVDKNGALLASWTGFPLDYFGVVTTANPASADAIDSAKDGLNRAGRRVQRQETSPLRSVQCLIWRFANGGKPVPDAMTKLEVDWVPPETATPSATAQAMQLQKTAGFVTADSRVALKVLGYSPNQIDQILADQKRNAANELVAQVADDIQSTQTRTAIAIEKDAATPPQPPGVAPIVVPPAVPPTK